ncbi:hypothetical protein GCM10011428_59020 [Streptomyces violaceus]
MTTNTHTTRAHSTGTARLEFAQSAPKAFRALIAFDAAAREGLDPALVELIQIRASHLNHCAYCLHMHTNDARKAGESEDRLHMVAVWREARHFFTERGTGGPRPHGGDHPRRRRGGPGRCLRAGRVPLR